MSWSVPTLVRRSKAAAYRSFLVGKCLKMVASLTPEACASAFVVVPLNPCRPNRAMAASMICALRSGADSRRAAVGGFAADGSLRVSLGTLRGGGRPASTAAWRRKAYVPGEPRGSPGTMGSTGVGC